MTDGALILKPGWRTLLQDLGRVGHYREGLTVSGPADLLSFLWANRLCGNPANTAALEVIYGNLTLQAETPMTVCITGADISIDLNGKAIATWQSINLSPGDILTLGKPRTGLINYLSVTGGFHTGRQFGSAATCVRESVGGLCGEAIKAGDRLAALSRPAERLFGLPSPKRPRFRYDLPIRVVPGWHYADFTKSARRQFFAGYYRISSNSDRMGYRLQGPATPWQGNQQMLSEGVVPGTIQIPPDGQPIIMHMDHQTIGGYPKIGTVATIDLWRLAQMAPGTVVRFGPVTRQHAHRLHRDTMRQFESTLPALTT